MFAAGEQVQPPTSPDSQVSFGTKNNSTVAGTQPPLSPFLLAIPLFFVLM